MKSKGSFRENLKEPRGKPLIQGKPHSILLALVIAASSLIQSTAYSSDNYPTLPAEVRENLTIEIIPQEPEDLCETPPSPGDCGPTQKAQALLKRYGDPTVLISEVQKLYDLAIENGQQRLDQYGEDLFNQKVDDNQMSILIAGLGRAEFTRVEGKRILRIVHNTGFSVLIVREDHVKEEDPVPLEAGISHQSKHLSRLMAKQSIMSDQGRGRDNLVIWIRNPNAQLSSNTETQYVVNPKDENRRSKYINVVFEAPKKPLKRLAFGLADGVFQGAYLVLLNEIGIQLGIAHHISWQTPLITLGFSIFYTVFNATYNNWMTLGSQTSMWWKRTIEKYVTTFLTVMFVGKTETAPKSGMSEHLRTAWGVAITNVGKGITYIVPMAEEKTRQVSGPVTKDSKVAGVPIGRVPFLRGLPLRDFRFKLFNYGYNLLKFPVLFFPNYGWAVYLSAIPIAQRGIIIPMMRKILDKEIDAIEANWDHLNEHERAAAIYRAEEARSSLESAWKQWNYSKRLHNSLPISFHKGTLQVALAAKELVGWVLRLKGDLEWQEENARLENRIFDLEHALDKVVSDGIQTRPYQPHCQELLEKMKAEDQHVEWKAPISAERQRTAA